MERIKRLKTEVWLLLGFTFLNRFGFFMSVPYLAFFLSYLHFTPIAIGTIVASQALAYSIGGIPAGYISDAFGKKNMMAIALIFNAISCIGLAEARSFSYYILFNVLFGLARSLFDSAMPAYLTNVIPKELQRFVFNLRFTIINVAGSIGPLIGIYFAKRHSPIVFDISAVIFVIAALLIMLALKQDRLISNKTSSKMLSLNKTFNVMKTDKSLLFIVLAQIIYYFAYMQLEAPLAQALQMRNPDTATWLFGLMWVINTLMIVVLQMPLSNWMKNIPLLKLAYGGSILLIISFIGLAFYTGTWTFSLSIALLTLGEIAIAPISSIVIAHIAPEELRGSYFGAISLATVGMGFSPIIGGAFLQYSNSETLFLTTAALLMISILFYHLCLRKLNV